MNHTQGSNVVDWLVNNGGSTLVAYQVNQPTKQMASQKIESYKTVETENTTALAKTPHIEVILQAREAGGLGVVTPLQWAWVYRLDGGRITRLLTNGAGILHTLRTDGDGSNPEDYSIRFHATPGARLDLFFSRSARPIPDAQLLTNGAVFQTRSATATMVLSAPAIFITQPTDLELWPILWEMPHPDYPTSGLSQGAALWSGTSLTVTENGPAPAPAAAIRPRERGLSIQGMVAAQATGVVLQILDANGNVLPLRTSSIATTNVQEINATLNAATGDIRTFHAAMFFADAERAFGPVQIVAQSVGLTPPLLTIASVQLCGYQIALVDDHVTNADGHQRGPILGESHERIVVDFLDSPQTTVAAISAETRARRMAVYSFANHSRLLNSAAPAGPANPIVLKPQMPLWMAELHVLGLTRDQLVNLLALRYFCSHHGLTATSPDSLSLELQWRLTLNWDGPDSNSPAFAFIARHNQTYQFTQAFEARQVVELHFGMDGLLTDPGGQALTLGPDGSVPNAFSSPNANPAFPVPNRRHPQAIVDGQRRAWGRAAGGTLRPALVIEYQPLIADAAAEEILRGGDGVLELVSLSIDHRPVDPGVTSGGMSARATLISLPVFRVNGVNPAPHRDVETLINTLVEERFRLEGAQPRVALLSLQCWQTTARRIFAHESPNDRQFEDRGVGRRRLSLRGHDILYGHENHMPFFGGPHGYGLGQVDDPPSSDDGVWSFVENLREAVRHLMVDKAGAAFSFISPHLPAVTDQRIRAIYQREIVRRYNGGTEFHWNGADWEISPSVAQWANNHDHTQGANPRLNYSNQVLGTRVVYFTGAGSTTVFPWPILYTPADYGPDT